MRSSLLPVLAACCLLMACGGPTDTDEVSSTPRVGRASEALVLGNGELLNGRTLNGRTLNGSDLSGLLVSVNLSGVQILGEPFPATVRLAGTELRHKGYKGTDFVGASLVGNLGEGSRVPLMIRSVLPVLGIPALNLGSGLFFYDVVYLDNESGHWMPACLDHSGNGVPALPIAGRWDYRSGVPGGGSFIDDPNTFTFACITGAIGKCILAGYQPWDKVKGLSLASYHQACTRLIRADFCGDGTSYTQNGRSIDLFDRLGIQKQTTAWPLESYWGPDKALCFRSHNRSHSKVPCYDPAFETTCTSTAVPAGEMIANEIP